MSDNCEQLSYNRSGPQKFPQVHHVLPGLQMPTLLVGEGMPL